MITNKRFRISCTFLVYGTSNEPQNDICNYLGPYSTCVILGTKSEGPTVQTRVSQVPEVDDHRSFLISEFGALVVPTARTYCFPVVWY